MRPQPSEIISGIRAILDDTIAPELTSDHARSRLIEIRAVLAQIDWDNAGFELVARADSLAAGLADARHWLPGELPSPPPAADYGSYQGYHEELAALATRTLENLRSVLTEAPSDLAASAVYRRLLTLV
ncbi:hypothetical protein GDN83_23200 [Gordonia jinghuaiqii]|uniref:Uncharacterized protein n=1 Tax=Gordonia jinghuaiqii TaxID=2758710 RepID=A0A7D7RRX4_9ACTN|nr:hypothetical protein [Gordonia jinghuaiqii]MCR5980595.1 hypothetical protein [Gordonia jinghuaiqii]QMT02653.1 hypothetical protein H1R19_05785 [Gordonia jinghuaiqii]